MDHRWIYLGPLDIHLSWGNISLTLDNSSLAADSSKQHQSECPCPPEEDRRQGSCSHLSPAKSIISCHFQSLPLLTWRGYLNKKSIFHRTILHFWIHNYASRRQIWFLLDTKHQEKVSGLNLKYVKVTLCLLWRFAIALKNQSCGPANASQSGGKMTTEGDSYVRDMESYNLTYLIWKLNFSLILNIKMMAAKLYVFQDNSSGVPQVTNLW